MLGHTGADGCVRVAAWCQQGRDSRATIRLSARHHLELDDVCDDHGVHGAGVWIVDVPRAVAEQEGGLNLHDAAIVADDVELHPFLKHVVIAIGVMNFEASEHHGNLPDDTTEVD
jgi:hypothetical protein